MTSLSKNILIQCAVCGKQMTFGESRILAIADGRNFKRDAEVCEECYLGNKEK